MRLRGLEEKELVGSGEAVREGFVGEVTLELVLETQAGFGMWQRSRRLPRQVGEPKNRLGGGDLP